MDAFDALDALGAQTEQRKPPPKTTNGEAHVAAPEPNARIAPFTHVTSNIKGGVDVALAPCTAIVGPNGARKTAVLDAIRLAVTGHHPVGPHPSDLQELAPDAQSELVAGIEGPSGAANIVLPIVRGAAKKPSHTRSGAIRDLTDEDLARALPTTALGDLLNFGTSKAREAIFVRFGGKNAPQADHPSGLTPEEITVWNAGWESGTKGAYADRLAALVTWFRSRKRAINAEARGAQTQVEADTARREERLAEVETAIAALKDEAAKMGARPADPDVTRETHAVAAAETVAARAREEREVAAGRAQKAAGIEQAVARVLAVLHSGDRANCPFCGHPADRAHLDVRHAAIREAAAARLGVSRRAAETAAAAEAALSAAKEKREVALRRVKTTQVAYDRALADLKQRAAGLKARRDELRALGTESPGPDARAAEVETYRKLEQAAGTLLQELLVTVRDAAEAAMNRYMPKGLVGVLDLEDGACRWQVVGRDGRPHGRDVASGSEWSALAVALACAWTEGAPLRVLPLDDGDLGRFDPPGLGAFLDRIRGRVESGDLTQAVVCWTRKDEIPAGWKVVEVG